MQSLRDLVVILPGIMGSVLKNKDGDDLWAPSGQALWQYISQRGKSLDALRLPPHDPDDPPRDGITADRVIAGFHGVLGLAKIDGYHGLVKAMKSSFQIDWLNFLPFPYDWRLSCRVNARRLKEAIADPLKRLKDIDPEARVILVAHSMGGLISQYYLEALNGWRDCRTLITFGTPFRGSVNAVDYLANGYKKVFVDLTEIMRTFPSVYELMPRYEMLKVGSSWKRVAECDGLPAGINPKMAKDGLLFHHEIDAAVRSNKGVPRDGFISPIVGVRQKTLQSAELANGRIMASHALPAKVDEAFDGGDGTVPRASAIPIELSDEGRETYFVEQHASLQNNADVLTDMVERLRRAQGRGLSDIQAFDDLAGAQGGTGFDFHSQDDDRPDIESQPWIGLDFQDLYLSNEEPVEMFATTNPSVPAQGIQALVQRVDAGGQGQPASYDFEATPSSNWRLRLDGLAAGRYRARVQPNDSGTDANAVTAVFEIADRR